MRASKADYFATNLCINAVISFDACLLHCVKWAAKHRATCKCCALDVVIELKMLCKIHGQL